MKTRTQRLTELAEHLDAARSECLITWAYTVMKGQTNIVKEVTEDIELSLECFGEVDPPDQIHYLAGPNFDRNLVMYAITGDHDYLPDNRVDPHITF